MANDKFDLNDVFNKIHKDEIPKQVVAEDKDVPVQEEPVVPTTSLDEKTKQEVSQTGQKIVNKKIVEGANTEAPKSSTVAPDFLSSLVEIQDGELRIKDDIRESTGGKIPASLWDAAKNSWMSNLGYQTHEQHRGMTNKTLILGLLIRDLNISEEQRTNLIQAFPRSEIISDIVNYKKVNPNDELTETLKNISEMVSDIKSDSRQHQTWVKKTLLSMKRVLAWLFMERVGLTVGMVRPASPTSEALSKLNTDSSLLMTNGLDEIGDAELAREKTRLNRKI